MNEKTKWFVWLHNRRAGLVYAEGEKGYICRGFRPEHGDLLAAAPDLLRACLEVAAGRGLRGHELEAYFYNRLLPIISAVIVDPPQS